MQHSKKYTRLATATGERAGYSCWLKHYVQDIYHHLSPKSVSKRITKNGCLYLSALDAFIPSALAYFDEPCNDTSKLKVAVGTDKTYTYSAGVNAITQSAGMLVYTTQADAKTQLWLVQAGTPTKPKMIGEYDSFALDTVLTLPSRAVVVVSHEADKTRTVWQLQPAGDSFTLMELTRGLR